MNKMLISTLLKFAYFDGSTVRVLHEGDLSKGTAHYYGVTWDDVGHLFLSGNIDTRYIIRRFLIHTFILPERVELPIMPADRFLLHETHQMFWTNGALYIANTGLNRLEILDNLGWRYHAWNPSTCDQEHINSIWSDDQYMYVAEHRQALSLPSVIRKCELGSLNLIDTIDVGLGIHNVYIEDGFLYTLTSAPCPAILKMDMASREISRIDKPEWGNTLVRGLARTEDYWYIGNSRWEPDRDKRNLGDAIIVQLDNDFNEVDRLVLPDFGPTCEIRVIGARDFAHNGIFMEAL